MAIEASLCMNPDIAGLVKVVPVALSDKQEVNNTRCVLRSTNIQINIGNMFLSCGDIGAVKPCGPSGIACEEVPVRTLDSVLAELKPSSIDAVKIDIEGHECKVLASGGSLFSKYAPKLVQVETNVGDSLNCVKHAAASFSYQVRSLGGDTALIPALKLHLFLTQTQPV
ncbi:unnamed protein product [Polarella glacialis]|uniref:Methyltransferase FkbM domain-containing protein n=1 Tax=Polarella glacialis TaxID=89957 RepID=A0A813J9P6_POLGL|nr:unnamed protein product [Polarella glacialis]